MWIATKIVSDKPADFLDRLTALSPDVCVVGDTALVSLAMTARYWNLGELLRSSDNAAKVMASPLGRKLAEISLREKVSWTLAPTAPWAYWLARHRGLAIGEVQIWTRESACATFAQEKIIAAEDFLPDLFPRGTPAEFTYFCESMNDLGLRKIADLARIAETGAAEELVRRFGLFCRKLLQRVSGSDDLNAPWYKPPMVLEERFYPELEDSISSPERTEGVLSRIEVLLNEWEERLAARKQLLKGLHVELCSEKKKRLRQMTFTLPKASRSAKSFMELLREAWLSPDAPAADSEFSLDIETVSLRSLGLEDESDRQLSLFDPGREERAEALNALVAKIYAQGSPDHPVRVGAYRPHASFWPEFSVEWVEWGDKPSLPMVADHPRRPLCLFRRAQPYKMRPLTTETEFLEFLREKNALDSLERINDPWVEPKGSPGSAQNGERTYARVGDTWVYWDRSRSQAFVHGYFEDSA